MNLQPIADQASTLLLFDNRSQQFLIDFSQDCRKGSYEYAFVLLTQAAMGFYNALTNQEEHLDPVILKAKKFLKNIDPKVLDPLNRAFYYKLVADIEYQSSLQRFEKKVKARMKVEPEDFYNEHDEKLRKILAQVMKLIPEDPRRNFPRELITRWIVLFPPYEKDLISFYKSNPNEEDRVVKLKKIIGQLWDECNAALGRSYFKKYLAAQKLSKGTAHKMKGFLSISQKTVISHVREAMHYEYLDTVDIKPPKQVSQNGILEAIEDLKQVLNQHKKERKHTEYTRSMLHLGILYYLSRNYEMAIRVLVKTLEEGKRINAADKELKVNRPNEFPDIPFMIGSSYLRIVLKKQADIRDVLDLEHYLLKAKNAFSRAIDLDPGYHAAYVNNVLIDCLLPDGNPVKLIKEYKAAFGDQVFSIDGMVFRHVALNEFKHEGYLLAPKVVFNLMVYLSSKHIEDSEHEAEEMLADLKTLYLLNSHDLVLAYHQKYVAQSRDQFSRFYEGLTDDGVHSALLFYFAHAFCALALKQSKMNGKEHVTIDYDKLQTAVELVTNSLFFHHENPSSTRLLNTVTHIIKYSLGEIRKKWENILINKSSASRMIMYEDYIRTMKVKQVLMERLQEVNLDIDTDNLDLPESIRLQMFQSLSDAQRMQAEQRAET